MGQSTVHELKTGIRAKTFKQPDFKHSLKNYFNSEELSGCNLSVLPNDEILEVSSNDGSQDARLFAAMD